MHYHPEPQGMANVVAVILVYKSGMIACFDSIILRDLERLDVELCVRGSGGYWASMRIESNLMLQIKEAQRDDGELWAIVQNVEDEVKIDNKWASGLLTSSWEIPMWKWDEISPDFVYWFGILLRKDMMRFGWLLMATKSDLLSYPFAKNYEYYLGNSSYGTVQHFFLQLSDGRREDHFRLWERGLRVVLCQPFDFCMVENVEAPIAGMKEFQVGDLRISESFAIQRCYNVLGSRASQSSIIGPFEILDLLGKVSYRLALHPAAYCTFTMF
ncbi:hypothetical protein Tco_1383257 [Tanacetum coccineum]